MEWLKGYAAVSDPTVSFGRGTLRYLDRIRREALVSSIIGPAFFDVRRAVAAFDAQLEDASRQLAVRGSAAVWPELRALGLVSTGRSSPAAARPRRFQ